MERKILDNFHGNEQIDGEHQCKVDLFALRAWLVPWVWKPQTKWSKFSRYFKKGVKLGPTKNTTFLSNKNCFTRMEKMSSEKGKNKLEKLFQASSLTLIFGLFSRIELELKTTKTGLKIKPHFEEFQELLEEFDQRFRCCYSENFSKPTKNEISG